MFFLRTSEERAQQAAVPIANSLRPYTQDFTAHRHEECSLGCQLVHVATHCSIDVLGGTSKWRHADNIGHTRERHNHYAIERCPVLHDMSLVNICSNVTYLGQGLLPMTMNDTALDNALVSAEEFSRRMTGLAQESEFPINMPQLSWKTR
eukprot:2470872-Amphidinium_carterae.1